MEHNFLHNEENHSNDEKSVAQTSSSVWVFGYGSLCWYPGFNYTKCLTGYIRGFVRRFWQGNITHRGTTDKPGRVATLIEDEKGITWGCAYKITGTTALEYLKQRECTLGGYVTLETKFYPRIGTDNCKVNGETFPCVLYIATNKNPLWLGEESLHKIALQIVKARGPSGYNAEYLLRLANFMLEEIPEVYDEHLFTLKSYVTDILHNMDISIESVMGPNPRKIQRDTYEEARPSSFEFTSRMPPKKLRCLDI